MSGRPEVSVHAEPAGALSAEVSAFVGGRDEGHFQQLPGWTAIDTEVSGAASWLVVARASGTIVGSAVLRVRRRRGLPVRLAEVRGGPIATSPEALAALLPALTGTARDRGAVRLIVAPRLAASASGPTVAVLEAGGLARPEPPLEPATLEVDLAPTPESILAGFRKTTRQEVRRALKEGVSIEEGDGADLGDVLQALHDRIEAKGATPHPAPFFLNLLASLRASPERGFVLVARRAGRTAGACVVFLFGRRARYAFGAIDAADGVPKGHLLQYEAMLAARRRGATIYDLNGFTEGTGSEGARTAVQKVNVWKAGFGGRVVPLLPARGRVLRPWLGALERAGERWGNRPS